MIDQEIKTQPETPDTETSDDHGDHPGDWQYIKVAIFLALLTALEVFTYFRSVHRLGDAALYAVLVVLMILKFVYVVLWFMHIKFDSPIFKKIFTLSLAMALVVYMCMLTSFEIWV